MTYKYYVCSQCGEFFQRIELENGYIHPCTKCNSPKLIEIPIDYRQHKRMMRKGTWDDFVKKTIEPYQGTPDYIGRPIKDYSSEYMEGDMWDATMNYYGVSRPLRSWMGERDRFLSSGWGPDV